ncbi:MAG: uroporphyrinogen-III synthase, partial [Nitrospirota bacterium]
FMEIIGEDADELLRDVAIAVIGPVTAGAVEKAGLKVEIMPETATIEAMVEEIIKWAIKKKTAI